MGRRTPDPKRPRQRLPMPLQRPWVKRSAKAEEARKRARRKLKPWQIREDRE